MERRGNKKARSHPIGPVEVQRATLPVDNVVEALGKHSRMGLLKPDYR
jgi:hypothetical protein